MAAVTAAGPVLEALLARLGELLGAVQFDSGPRGARASVGLHEGVATQQATVPYLIVGGDTNETPYHTLGPADGAKWGGQVRLTLRLVTKYPTSEVQTWRIWHVIRAALDQQPLTVAGFGEGAVTIEGASLLSDVIAGVVTRELVATCDVLVHQ